MAREVPDWLDGYLRYTFNTESPTSFHTWCGLSVLAGVLQRKVYLQAGFERIYPNLYVVLVGPSGSRKGLALGIAKQLLKGVPKISVAPESSSGREAMVQAMKRAFTNFSDPKSGKVLFHSSLTAFSEELSVFLGQKDIKYLANITDWYDSKDAWEYETINRGLDSLQGVCFNLMGATAPDWMQSMLPQEAIGGGLTARIIFVVEERKGKTVPRHDVTPEEVALGEALARDLERISLLCGPMTYDPAAEEAYVGWYTDQEDKAYHGQLAIPDPRFATYCDRRATHLRKLMLSISASRSDSLIITEADFDRALAILIRTERKMHRAFGGLGRARHSDMTDRVSEYLRLLKITTRSALLTKFRLDLDAPTLHIIEDSLAQQRVISVELVPTSGDKVYRWIGEQ